MILDKKGTVCYVVNEGLIKFIRTSLIKLVWYVSIFKIN